MFNTLCNKKGFSIIEAMIAVVVTTVAIIAMGTMQPLALRTSASSDYVARAVAIAQAEAAYCETLVMYTGTTTPNLTNCNQTFVYPVPNTAIIFTVTTATQQTTVGKQNIWLVTVKVTWPGTTTGVTHNRVVTQQTG
jgi:Tfp pilus assembly protein PilV